MVVWCIISVWLAALFAITCRVSHRPGCAHGSAPSVPYTLIRICGGPEPHLRENLLSVLRAAGRAPDSVLLVMPHDDPQLGTTRAVLDALRQAGLFATLLTTDVRGPNHKVAQLDASMPWWPAHHDIVCADGDVDLTGYSLDALRAPLAQSDVAAVWAPCAEVGDNPSAAVLTSGLHCFALLGRLDPGGMVGKLWAVRRAAVLRAGGWASLVDILGEDMELARRLRLLGMRVVMASKAAWSRPAPRCWSETVGRYARWFWVIRAQRPHLLVTYPLFFFGTSGVLVLCTIQAVQWPLAAGGAAGLAVLLRLLLAANARRAIGIDCRHLLTASLIGELIVLVAFARMLSQRTVHWRHQRLRVQRGGRIVATGAAW